MQKLKVLVACEESQRVCTAFRELGHEAYSCDIQEPSGGHPEWHILGDVLEVLNPKDRYGTVVKGIAFTTMDGEFHTFPGKWDIIIAHPPCTYLSNAGACRLYPKKGVLNQERYRKGLQAKEFFMQFLNADCEHIAVENPIPSKVYEMPPYSQTIQPYEYGHPYSKKTCLWLKNLPELQPTNIVKPIGPWVCGNSIQWKKQAQNGEVVGKEKSAKHRSKTFERIAKAMAEQWTEFLINGDDTMKRCYEIEHFEAVTGRKEKYCHCGNARKGTDGLYYCPTDGRFEGYAGKCAAIDPPESMKPKQLSFFEE